MRGISTTSLLLRDATAQARLASPWQEKAGNLCDASLASSLSRPGSSASSFAMAHAKLYRSCGWKRLSRRRESSATTRRSGACLISRCANDHITPTMLWGVKSPRFKAASSATLRKNWASPSSSLAKDHASFCMSRRSNAADLVTTCSDMLCKHSAERSRSVANAHAQSATSRGSKRSTKSTSTLEQRSASKPSIACFPLRYAAANSVPLMLPGSPSSAASVTSRITALMSRPKAGACSWSLVTVLLSLPSRRKHANATEPAMRGR
mmetsp:Transcript_25385/g.73193  ORF Transcript_25385/g.73193 Transcript_25385/m.73193 type:complete len:266 (-) Transcript_25385:250-1047(-)